MKCEYNVALITGGENPADMIPALTIENLSKVYGNGFEALAAAEDIGEGIG